MTVMAMSRREFSKAVKVAAWERCGGHCEVCTVKLFPGKFRYDHDLPDYLGGKPTLENCVVRCSNCDSEKTYGEDIPKIARTKRMRDKHIGAQTRKSRPLPGSRASGIRKRMSGKVESW